MQKRNHHELKKGPQPETGNLRLYDKHIAVVGVSTNENKFSFKIFRDLLKHHFKVSGVNPKGQMVLGRRIYKDLRDIESVPDIVITVVPPEVTEKIVEIARGMGIREIWMQPGSESEKAIAQARKYGISVTSNACFMVIAGIW